MTEADFTNSANDSTEVVCVSFSSYGHGNFIFALDPNIGSTRPESDKCKTRFSIEQKNENNRKIAIVFAF